MSIRDFKAKNIRTTNIIASGSSVSEGVPSILVYSASAATNSVGGQHADLLTKVGTDVFLFVSGTKLVDSNGTPTFSKNSNNRIDTTVFGGDVVISGTMYAVRERKKSITISRSSTIRIAISFARLFAISSDCIESDC